MQTYRTLLAPFTSVIIFLSQKALVCVNRYQNQKMWLLHMCTRENNLPPTLFDETVNSKANIKLNFSI
jgi:hypothetical protein